MIRLSLIFFLMGLSPLIWGQVIPAQDSPPKDSVEGASKINEKLAYKYVNAIEKKSEGVTNEIEKETTRYLDRLEKEERKLQRKLNKIDSVASQNIFSNSQQRYQQIRDQLKNKSPRLLRSSGQYIPWLDTSMNSLKFIESGQLAGKLPVSPEKIKEALKNVHDLQDKLKQAKCKRFIRGKRVLADISRV